MDTAPRDPQQQPSMPPARPAETLERELDRLRAIVEKNAPAIALLGEWPPWIEPDSLVQRVPRVGETDVSGFDAGVACALNLIPEQRQSLAAHLHANYSPTSVAQVRREISQKDPEAESTWWLAACAICKEDKVDGPLFLEQVQAFTALARDAGQRLEVAMREYEAMMESFILIDGAPFGERDGCMQAAYLAGYPFASMYASSNDLYHIGTIEDSLGLEDFPWSDATDAQGRRRSGPVHGSRQFVKCATKEEWLKALEVVRQKLPAMPEADQAAETA